MIQVSFSGRIGEGGITSGWFFDALRAAQGDHIELLISSPGGDVFEGKAILDEMKRYSGTITGRVTGLAASMASAVAAACDTLIVTSQSVAMLHRASGGVAGNRNQMRQAAEILDRIDMQLSEIYAKKTGRSTAEILELMDKESWFFGNEIADLGLADYIEEDEQEELEREEAVAVAQRKFNAVYAPPTPERIAAYTESITQGLTAEDLQAARMAQMSPEEYKLYMPVEKELTEAEIEAKAAKVAGMSMEDFRKYSAMVVDK